MSGDAKFFVGVAAAAVLVIVGVAVFNKQKPPVTEVDLSLARTLGEATAPVTITEFGDFQCPACAAAAAPLEEVYERNKEKVRLAYIHFPLPSHKNAEVAAAASEAAHLQGKFWEIYDLLFSRQSQWAEVSDPKLIFRGYAGELGLNVDQFAKDLDSGEVRNAVRAGKNHGLDLDVNQTPTFYINGKKITGVRSADDWQKLIDEAAAS